MRHLILVAPLAFGLAMPAMAQQPGRYAIDGTNADGSSYGGTLDLAAGPNNIWRLTWRVGGTVTEGIGLVQAGVLAVAYANGARPGVVAYRILPDGRLDGPWSTGGRPGREVLTLPGAAK